MFSKILFIAELHTKAQEVADNKTQPLFCKIRQTEQEFIAKATQVELQKKLRGYQSFLKTC